MGNYRIVYTQEHRRDEQWNGRKFEFSTSDLYEYTKEEAEAELLKAKQFCLENEYVGECYIDKDFEDNDQE